MAFDLSSSWSNPSWTSTDQFGVGGGFSKGFYDQADSYGQSAFSNTKSASTGTSPFGNVATAFLNAFSDRLRQQQSGGSGGGIWTPKESQSDSKNAGSGFFESAGGDIWGIAGRPAQVAYAYTPPKQQSVGGQILSIAAPIATAAIPGIGGAIAGAALSAGSAALG